MTITNGWMIGRQDAINAVRGKWMVIIPQHWMVCLGALSFIIVVKSGFQSWYSTG
ncbi:hypothetical protein WMW72_27475 [Paenibacillus filicis]|uniref:Uncharacterized protein n=1 Tax=Paenibacillus filicis TaxID=669464 RepID=A0ABU9DU05_9BACL